MKKEKKTQVCIHNVRINISSWFVQEAENHMASEAIMNACRYHPHLHRRRLMIPHGNPAVFDTSAAYVHQTPPSPQPASDK
jgi:hypothetical protein